MQNEKVYVYVQENPETYVQEPRVFRSSEAAREALREDVTDFFSFCEEVKSFDDVKNIVGEDSFSEDFIEYEENSGCISSETYRWVIYESPLEG